MSSLNSNTDWMSTAGYGIMFHYLAGEAGLGAEYNPLQWKYEVESFNVYSFVDKILYTGAKYMIFTIGQNSGFYCAPNSFFDKKTGYIFEPDSNTEIDTQKRTTNRDLPMEIIDELTARQSDIKVLLYAPVHPAASDKKVLSMYEWQYNSGLYGTPVPNDSIIAEEWYKTLGWWSKHYGSKIAGWWLDGFYDESIHDTRLLTEYLKSGNPDSIVAYNTGVTNHRVTEFDDYLAGEQNDDMYRFGNGRWTNNKQSHILTYLGTNWGQGEIPQYSVDRVTETVRNLMNNEICITYDIPIEKNGDIATAFLETLHQVRLNLNV
jgi:hypothetical protein